MADSSYLPPVVIQVLMDDEAALAQMQGLRTAMADTAADMDASTTAMGSSLGSAGRDMENLDADAAGALGGVSTSMADAGEDAGKLADDTENAASDFAGSMGGMQHASEDAKEGVHDATQDMKSDVENLASDLGGMGLPAEKGADDAKDAMRDMGTGAKDLQSDLDEALAGTPYERAARAAEDAEKDEAESGSRMKSIFQDLGNTMGNFGLPFSGAVKNVGEDMEKGESDAKGFGSSFLGMGSNVEMAAGIVVAAVAAMSIKSAVEFEDAQRKLKLALTDTGQSYSKMEPEIKKTYEATEHLGFNSTETATAMTKLAISAKSPAQAQEELGIAMNLARLKGISLTEATETLVKVNAGSNRGLVQMGLNLNIGSAKLSAQQTATEGVTKAKMALKAAETAYSETEKKAAEEHKAAVEKVAAAEEGVKQAQEALKSDSEGLTQAQTTLKEAQKGVGETAKKAAEEVVTAQRSFKASTEGVSKAQRELSEAQRGVKETAVQEEEAVKHARETLTGAEESATEAAQTGSDAVTAAHLRMQLTQSEVNSGKITGVEASVKLKEAELQLTEAEQKKSDSQKKTANEVTKAQEELHKSEREAGPASAASIAAATKVKSAQEGVAQAERAAKTSEEALGKARRETAANSPTMVAAANRVREAQKGVSSAETKLAQDQEKAGKASRELRTDQAAEAKGSDAVKAASEKLKVAHENLTRAEEKLQRDTHTTAQVLEALARVTKGQAADATHTLSGETDVLKAEVHNLATELGVKLLPALKAMVPILKGLVDLVVVLGKAIGQLGTWWKEAWEKIGLAFYENVGKIKTGAHDIVSALGWIIEAGWEVIKFFFMMPVRIVKALAGLVSDMVKLGREIVEGIVHGIESAPGAVVHAIEGLIPGGGVIGEAASAIGLATGGIVTKPTLAVVGEAGPEAVIPLKGAGVSPAGVQPLGAQAPGSGPSATAGLHIGTLNVNAAGQTEPQLISNLYLRLRPMLQGA
jgi:hypothetical protein